MSGKGGRFVRCRCGDIHPLRERETSCIYCNGPTWDHHAVCACCRGLERQRPASRQPDRGSAALVEDLDEMEDATG